MSRPGPRRGRPAPSPTFAERCEDALNNVFLRQKLRHALDLSVAGRLRRAGEVEQWEEMRDQGHAVRMHTLSKLDEYLERFIANAKAAGATVVLAEDAKAARQYILKLALERDCRRVVKSKSMVTEEIRLRPALQRAGLSVIETDLGEFIVQLAGQPPSHLTGPATHMSRQDIGRLLSEELDFPYTDDPQALTARVRERLRSDFLSADLGISGANFLVADTGSLVIMENEGNVRLSTSLPPIHVAVSGIEKVVPRLADAAMLVQLVAGSNRTAMLADPVLRQALACVRCAACLNVCPVYRRVGGHAYGWTYPGPVGKLLGMELWGKAEGAELAHGSTLCGACKEACSVRIDLPSVFLRLRDRAVRQGLCRGRERRAIKLWRWVMRRPRVYRAVPNWALRFAGRWLPRLVSSIAGSWSATRELPEPARETFAQAWRRTGGFADD